MQLAYRLESVCIRQIEPTMQILQQMQHIFFFSLFISFEIIFRADRCSSHH